MRRRDKVTLAVLAFFFVPAVTVELYFVVAHRHLVAATPQNPLAWLLSLYGPTDSAFYDAPTPLGLFLEGFQVFVTTPLGLVLAWGIVRRRAWRWPLQLAVGAYVSYSVILYFAVEQLSGYGTMSGRSAGKLALLYGANLPWLVAYGWLGWDAAREMVARLGRASAPTIVERERIAPVVEDFGEEPAEIEARRQGGDHGEGAEPLAP
jgi:hypothetical protein